MSKPVLLVVLIIVLLLSISLGIFLINKGSEPKPLQVIKKEAPFFGIYEVCSDIENCEPEKGIDKIKSIGASAVIVTVVDTEDLKAVTYYPSQFLPMASYVSAGYLERTIKLAHQKGIKIYASINLPHYYWLNKHPDWLVVFSDGKKADEYGDDYFSRIVPPSRIISEQECIDLLYNIINEVIDYGVDGIDINDNFQFSDEYIEATDTTLFSSFDDFTIKKFEQNTGLIAQGSNAKEKAEFIMKNQALYFAWLQFRAEQVTELIKVLKQAVAERVIFRPHILTHEDPYIYYGLDYKKIAPNVDVLYLMITPDREKQEYFEIIANGHNAGAKRIAVSTYLLKEIGNSEIEKDKNTISERIQWLQQARADEIYIYNFELIDKVNLWPILKNIFDTI